jgi:hypothetical protein
VKRALKVADPRLAYAPGCGEAPSRDLDDVHRALEALPASLAMTDFLCHGELGNLERRASSPSSTEDLALRWNP